MRRPTRQRDGQKVIVAVTDAKKGAARVTADKEGYKSFIIPDNVGGRFSVLTPVGLLPIAVAGFDIEKLVAGAADMEKLVEPRFLLRKIPQQSMPLPAMNCIKVERR